MKHTYINLLLIALAMTTTFLANAENFDDINLPEEKWEMHYQCYQWLWNDSPQYRDQSHEVTIKRDHGRIYIRGISKEYPDAWIKAYYYTKVLLTKVQELSKDDETPAYLLFGDANLISASATDREYSVGVNLKPMASIVWEFDNENDTLLLPENQRKAVWISDKPEGEMAFTRAYHFDGTVTGDDFGPRPIYLFPTFRKISESGIMDAVMDGQQPVDTRVFDLSGRQVNPDRLTPGIYIRAGRKFIVRRQQRADSSSGSPSRVQTQANAYCKIFHRNLDLFCARLGESSLLRHIFGNENFSLTLRIGGKNV